MASGHIGLGNGLKTYDTGTFTYLKGGSSGGSSACTALASSQGAPWTFLEDNLSFHANSVMLFRGSINLHGDGGTFADWINDTFVGSAYWGSPIIEDDALDNLYHYSLADIKQYGQYQPGLTNPHDPVVTIPTQYQDDETYAEIQCKSLLEGGSWLVYAPSGASKPHILPHWDNPNDPTIFANFESCLKNLRPLPTSIIMFPMLFSDYQNKTSHSQLLKAALLDLQFQPIVGGTDYGAARYGSVLYQFARKFFPGAPSTPKKSEMVFAGNDVDGWHTGGMYGTKSAYGGGNADFSGLKLDFPHTYLGGNPFICANGGSVADSCSKGKATWPTWLVPPDMYGNDQRDFLDFLASQESPTQSLSQLQSERAALIYLGWASHLMQDLALPHHARNYSSARHAWQDSIGDFFALLDLRTSQPKYVAQDAGSQLQCLAMDSDLATLDAERNISMQDPYGLADLGKMLTGFLDKVTSDLDYSISAYNSRGGFDQTSYCNNAALLPWPADPDADLGHEAVFPAFAKQGAESAAALKGVYDAGDKPLDSSPQAAWVAEHIPITDSYAKAIIERAITGTVNLILCAAPPSAKGPTQLLAVPVHRGLDLSWVPGDNTAVAFNIYTQSSGSAGYSLAGQTTNAQPWYLLTGLTDGDAYSVIVAAVDGNGVEGAWSTAVSGVPSPSPRLVAPGLESVIPGDGSTTLTWLSVDGASWYNVFTKTDPNASFDESQPVGACTTRGDSSTFVCTVPGLTNGTTYYVAVEAENSQYPQGNPMSTVVAVIPSATTLPAPQNLVAVPVNQGIDLSWDPVPGATDYLVATIGFAPNYVYATEDFVTNATLIKTGLQNGIGFTVIVAARDGTQAGPDVTAVVTPNPSPALTAPVLQAAQSSGHVQLSWGSVSNAAWYRVYMSTNGTIDPASSIDTTYGTSYTTQALTYAVTYSFAVQASNSDHLSDGSLSNVVTLEITSGPPIAPGAPTGVYAVAGNGKVTVTWQTAPGIANFYSVLSGPSAQGPFTAVGSTSGLSFVDTTVSNGATYYYVVAGVNDAGPGQQSSPAVAATPFAPCPGGPTCSGHGTCSLLGICSCASGYSGADCSVTCSGGPTCSGHGECSLGNCTCQAGYLLPSCSVYCASSHGHICPYGVACGNNDDCESYVCQKGICQPPSCSPHCNQGAPCGENSDCGGRVCSAGLCQAPACSAQCSKGAACNNNGDCASRVCSGSNICEAPACSPSCGQGSPCGGSGDCLSHVCTAGQCRQPACSPICKKGAACGNNGDCASHNCVNGSCK